MADYTRIWKRYPNRRVDSTVIRTNKIVVGIMVTLCGVVGAVRVSEMQAMPCCNGSRYDKLVDVYTTLELITLYCI